MDDVARFKTFVRDVVRPRLTDVDGGFDAELRALGTTGMNPKFIKRLLTAVPEPVGWEIGEALAECALQFDSGHNVHWPWNSVRDRRTPRASLPGSDLVGFRRDSATAQLLFGEVKTSSDADTPPGVMHGSSGMIWQLQENITRLDVQRTLLAWLRARCQTDLDRELYEKSVGRFLSSSGKDLFVIGVLIRDTSPAPLDLQNRAKALESQVAAPMCAALLAWYLPVEIDEWPGLVKEKKSP